MTTTHITGGVLGYLVGVILVGMLRHYGVSSIDPTEAAAVGGGFAAGGIAVVHAVWNIGVGPIVRRIVHGPSQPAAPTPPPPPVVTP